MLFSPDRLPWGTVIRSSLLDTVHNAKSDLNAYEKANEFLQLLVDAAGNRSNYIPRESAVSIAGDREFIAALWHGVTSRYIQFRMFKSSLSKRDALVQLGAEEDDLPLSPELAKAKETPSPAEVELEESVANAATIDSDFSFFDNDGSQE